MISSYSLHTSSFFCDSDLICEKKREKNKKGRYRKCTSLERDDKAHVVYTLLKIFYFHDTVLYYFLYTCIKKNVQNHQHTSRTFLFLYFFFYRLSFTYAAYLHIHIFSRLILYKTEAVFSL